MDKLLLIRHSQSRQDPARPASQWSLSDEGRRRCAALAERLAAYRLDTIVTSREPKAAETGALVAARLGLAVEATEGLHEHQRERAGYCSPEAFERAVAAFFEHRDKLVFGEETARQAEERFDRAVRSVLARHPARDVAIVSHGTVISLFVARHASVAPTPFWKSLGMPAVVVMALPELALLEVSG
jgi:broad specificity phosphatase PhoE